MPTSKQWQKDAAKRLRLAEKAEAKLTRKIPADEFTVLTEFTKAGTKRGYWVHCWVYVTD